MKGRLALITLALVLAGAGLAEAQCCDGGWHGGPGSWHGGSGGWHGGISSLGDCSSAGCGDADDFCGTTGCYPVLVLLQDLDLSRAQWDEIDAIVEDTQTRVEEAFGDAGFENPFDGFLQVFTQGNLTASNLAAFTDKMDQLRETLVGIQNETLVRIHDVLTSDQLAELSQLDTDESWCGPNWGWDECGSIGHGVRDY